MRSGGGWKICILSGAAARTGEGNNKKGKKLYIKGDHGF